MIIEVSSTFAGCSRTIEDSSMNYISKVLYIIVVTILHESTSLAQLHHGHRQDEATNAKLTVNFGKLIRHSLRALKRK